MRIVIITVTRNGVASVKKCCNSIRKNAGREYEHYIIDNNSDDGVREWLGSNYNMFDGIEYNKNSIPNGMAVNQAISGVLWQAPDLVIKTRYDFEVISPQFIKEIADTYTDFGIFSAKHILAASIADDGDNNKITYEKNIDKSMLIIPFTVIKQWRFPTDAFTEDDNDKLFLDWCRNNGCSIGTLNSVKIKKWTM